MENLTRSLRIAFNAPDCNPVPDHELVVFKKAGAGLEFRESVPAGKRFQKRLLERGEFEAFAISTDENLRYTFSQPYTHADLMHTFILHFTVYFKVANSRRLTEKLDSDPLKRLKEEIAAILGGTARQVEWQVMAEENGGFERMLLEQRATSEQGVDLSNLERVRQVAQDFGIAVRKIAIQRTLPKEGGILQTDYDADLKHQLKKRQIARDRYEEAYRATTNVIVGSIGKVTDSSSTVDVRRTIEGLETVERTTAGLLDSAVSSLPSSRPQFKSPAVVVNSPYGDLLSRALKLISELGRESPPERRLGSSMLHVIAELLLEEDAEDEALKKYAKQLGEPFRDLYLQGRLRDDQIEVVQQLQEPPFRGHESGQGRP